MTAVDIQSELSAGHCVSILTPGQLEWLKVILLWRILTGDASMTATDIQDLLDSSPCVAQLKEGELQWLEVILLSGILEGGGGGVGAARQVYQTADADPNVAGLTPADPTHAAIWYHDGVLGFSMMLWDVPSQQWI